MKAMRAFARVAVVCSVVAGLAGCVGPAVDSDEEVGEAESELLLDAYGCWARLRECTEFCADTTPGYFDTCANGCDSEFNFCANLAAMEEPVLDN
jgi:hypothetical protein